MEGIACTPVEPTPLTCPPDQKSTNQTYDDEHMDNPSIRILLLDNDFKMCPQDQERGMSLCVCQTLTGFNLKYMTIVSLWFCEAFFQSQPVK